MGRRRKRKHRLPQESVEVMIESLSHDGRGVTHIANKAIFIDGALPNEKVLFQYTKITRKYDEGKVTEVLIASPDRVEAKCPHFDICGGCSLQHLEAKAQIKYKQQAMLNNLKHIGNVVPATIFPAITNDNVWGYRRKARLGVKFVYKKDRVLVGFREKRHRFLADISQCEVLHPAIGQRITALQALITALDAKKRIPQIEVAIGDTSVSLIFRHLDPLSTSDLKKLSQFAKTFEFNLYLQPAGPDSVHLLYPITTDQIELFYRHPQFNTRIDFSPLDFFQINTAINRQMVAKTIELLQLQPQDKVLDLFCGLGNFTLPIARFAKQVTGVEGDVRMVRRARETARKNSIQNTDYYVCNLAAEKQAQQHQPWLKQSFNKILLDPPRSGAKEIIPLLAKLNAKRIVYVSCHPATLARDAGELVRKQGYHLAGTGVMDMFPHTTHVESIAVFVKK